MTTSSVPLSLLSKGIGQLSKNGHERLDVYLEPEDYYNLKSKYQQYQLQELRRRAAQTDISEHSSNEQTKFPLHKTFLTRKGALLLFSEELAKKTLEEEKKKQLFKDRKDKGSSEVTETVVEKNELTHETLKTCNDLSWAILTYGMKPEYRKKGEELYLRFVHEPKGGPKERRIRPGFSPKRYISTWSRYWDEGMLQKLRSGGMISDKTLYRQNPLLPHLYKSASYNLSSRPPPYRVTKSMLLAPGNVPSYEFYRVKAPQKAMSEFDLETESRAPPPSQMDVSVVDPDPLSAIQAVKYHETGEIQEVAYSDLKPQEKQEILAELLIAAHEHQQNIRETLELVITSQRPRNGSERGGSSSAASELMVDMQRAILSLVESPMRQQMRERQRLLQEQEERMQEEKRKQELKEEKRQKRRAERKAKKEAEQALAKKAAEEALAKKAAERALKKQAEKAALEKQPKPPSPVQDVSEKPPDDDAKDEERKQKEERRKKRREEREARRKLREEKAVQEAKAKKEQEAIKLTAEADNEERPPSRDEHRPQSPAHDQHHRSHPRHRHRDQENDAGREKRKDKRESKSKRRIEKESKESSQPPVSHPHRVVIAKTNTEEPQVYLDTAQSGTGYVEDQIRGSYEDTGEVYTVLSQEGVTEIKHAKDARRTLQRRNAGLRPGVPTMAPVNTPAVDMRTLGKSQMEASVEYDEVIILEQPRRKSHASSVSGSDVMPPKNQRAEVIHKDIRIRDVPQSARSAASTQSSGPKPTLFAPELPTEETVSQKQGGSFYGGRMPITSQIVKQTMPDKVSIISASQESESVHGTSRVSPKPSSGQPSVTKKSNTGSEMKPAERIVPSIGIEPATPLNANIQKSISPNQQSVLSSNVQAASGKHYLSPSGSFSSGHRTLPRQPDPDDGDRDSYQGERSLDGSEGDRSTKKAPSKKNSDDDDSDNNDQSSQISSSTEQKSSKRSFASKSSQTTSSRKSKKSKKSDHASLKSDSTLSDSSKSWLSKHSKPKFSGMKGLKGPGSQSSSSFLKSTSTKKSRSIRGSLPSAMKRGSHKVSASVTMPGGEVVSVGGSLTRPAEDTLTESETEPSNEVSTSKEPVPKLPSSDAESLVPKSVLKSSSVKSGTNNSETKSERRVSFQELNPAVSQNTTDDEDVDVMSSNPIVTDYEDTEEETDNDAEWPDVQEEEVKSSEAPSDGTRSVSSRSQRLTEHAQKVAAIVVKKQRSQSGLDDDATEAAALWNKVLEEEGAEESEEISEEDEWEGAKQKPASSIAATSSTSEKAQPETKEPSESESEQKRKSRLQQVLSEKPKEKEISATVPSLTPKKKPSTTASVSSIASSVSSAQEAFVNEMQRKASDFGIEARDLEFQADVVTKLEKSEITPDEVEVVHDTETGRHIVRSRRSSTTVSSVLTPSSVGEKKETPREAKQPSESTPKQKLVVDLNLDKHASVTPSRASSVTSSMTSASPTSQLHSPRSVTSQRRPSIPTDKTEVKLGYDVTTYESKLGDPKPEEPVTQASRPHVEPQKIKHVDPKPTKSDAKAKPKHPAVEKTAAIDASESVKSGKSSTASKPASKPSTKSKQPHAPTKGPLRKGQAAVAKEKEVRKDENGETKTASSTEAESLHEEEQAPKEEENISESQTSVGKKSESKKKKVGKTKEKPAETSLTETKRSSPEKLPAKTPETPFRTGQPKQVMPVIASPEDTGKQESIASESKSKRGGKTKPSKTKKKEPVTQVEVDFPKTPEKAASPAVVAVASPVASPTKQSEKQTSDDEDYIGEYTPAQSPEDDYEFVRREDTPEPEPTEVIESPPKSSPKPEETKSQVSEVTEATEATEISSQAAAQAAEDEAIKEAKLAAKQEREAKRAAAAEKKRKEVERKRKEKEEQMRKEKEEQERQEQMREELEAERKKREEAIRLRKEEAEKEKQREKEEEELRQRRLLQQQERERKQMEEHRRKMEELQRKKKEEEERKREQARKEAEAAAELKRQEEEMMAEMEESERELYAQKKREEDEERKRKEEERRIREEEEAKIAMEQARLQAIIKAKQAAALEEKLRFVREFFTEANGLDQTQNVNRSFTFSYFELMQMLGLDVLIE